MADWKQSLVTQIKNFQKEGQSQKEAWYRFVQEKTGDTNFDPNRHDEAFLMEFTSMLDAGSVELKAPTGYGSANKKGGAGGGWGGGGNWGKGGGKQMMMQQMMQMMMASWGGDSWGGDGWGGQGGAKRQKVSTGDAKKDKLVDRIKSYQRSDQTQKEYWWSFCDEQLSGVRDPAKHDTATLEMFCTQYGVP